MKITSVFCNSSNKWQTNGLDNVICTSNITSRAPPSTWKSKRWRMLLFDILCFRCCILHMYAQLILDKIYTRYIRSICKLHERAHIYCTYCTFTMNDFPNTKLFVYCCVEYSCFHNSFRKWTFAFTKSTRLNSVLKHLHLL